MKTRSSKLVISLILILAASCNEPETTVTNIVHSDGSVTRRIEMRNQKRVFDKTAIQVPVDSTWTIKDSLEISSKGDTIWVRRAEKLFRNTDAINREYSSDSSANKNFSRRTEFTRKFRWFNTEYRFAEIIEKKLKHGYPVNDFLNKEELKWFYLPGNIKDKKKMSADSLKYRAFNDTVDKKCEKWEIRSLVSEWIYEFAALAGKREKGEITVESLKTHEDEFVKFIESDNLKLDSLWTTNVMLGKLIGEKAALKYRHEADSAGSIVVNHFFVDFKEYTVRTIMPGKITSTNGIVDSSGMSVWPVKSDFFLTQTYEMWAGSKSSNLWAWIISFLFLIFVFTGLIIKRKRAG